MSIEIGFELEFGCNATDSEIRNMLKGIFPETRNARKTRDRFFVTDDMSVDTNRENSSIEIVTPVWTVSTASKNLKKLFDMLVLLNAETNTSTGLHINIGYRDPKKTMQIDESKLVLNVDQDKYLKMFKRTRCEYSQKIVVPFNRKKDTVDSIYNKMKDKVKDPDKYEAINLSKLDVKKGKGWIEFRIVGGKDYHKRYRDVRDAMIHFYEALVNSTDQSTYRMTRTTNRNYKLKGKKAA
jgi:hypothetical protein